MILEIRNFTQNEIDEEFFRNIAEKAQKIFGLTGNIEIGLAIVGDGRIRKLNKMYRGKNRVTDVLSFASRSVIPYLAKAFPRIKKNQEIEFIEPPDGVRHLGEIILCYPQAKKQARRLSNPLEKELSLLFVHGILHLIGYEHENGGEQEKKMKEMEEQIMTKISNS